MCILNFPDCDDEDTIIEEIFGITEWCVLEYSVYNGVCRTGSMKWKVRSLSICVDLFISARVERTNSNNERFIGC